MMCSPQEGPCFKHVSDFMKCSKNLLCHRTSYVKLYTQDSAMGTEMVILRGVSFVNAHYVDTRSPIRVTHRRS